MAGYTLFETPIGQCGLAWSERGVVAVYFPEANEAATRRRIEHRWPELAEANPPPPIAAAVAAIRTLLDGGRQDLTGVDLDMDGIEPAERAILEAARRIPPGQTRTYGELAGDIGRPGSAREVGAAMARNRFPIVVPCHRVLAAGGGFGGFSAPGGLESKAGLLTIERAATSPAPLLFDDLPISVRPPRPP
ncbi:MAG TPA: methylated-DNA--[protein]-cysteine S-methyltransferase [Caulobacteraceae bacterium]|jgi:methylated-DNA-[protein]-cysteine S-methyltransferase|nr:methylated-DNA--[protein]-cysteine S-methyltransferase [Caulobacteraceae bacterium]